ncbi:hypothetical protein [Burkholderia cepacia]|uniref:hypothetical protein n=1 Tax=Burkholderia cepacia TaxID=292 RepID=UPI0026DF1030|nr:hypothetical protein [Burkholderia cepacia]MDO5943351.1 hypothetical protein [Burkholderia cepacia]
MNIFTKFFSQFARRPQTPFEFEVAQVMSKDLSHIEISRGSISTKNHILSPEKVAYFQQVASDIAKSNKLTPDEFFRGIDQR